MLRAIAVLFVVLDHSLKFFGHPLLFGIDVQWVGKLGVMFFFVHTCMVLMLSLERSDGKFRTLEFISNFYLRRIFRIYPLSIFAIVFVLIFSIPSAAIERRFFISQFTPSHKELLLNLMLMQNHHGRSIIAVLWSLPFEVQMYVFLPFVFILFARRGKLAWLFVIWTLGWIVAYLARPHAIFIAHFIPGVIAYVILKRVRTPRIPGWAWPIFLGCLTLTFLAFRPSFITGGFACLLLGVVLPYFRDIRLKSLNLTTHNIAKYSYGVYLSHMFCLWFAFIHLWSQPILLRSFVFVSFLIGVPVLLFHLLEDPMIRVGATLGSRLFVGNGKERNESVANVQTEELEETASGL
jgi:peptidoglycan/LPS O-acetylase OafA/YrhL